MSESPPRISRLSDTPFKVVVWNAAAFVVCSYVAWFVDRDEGVTSSTVFLWAVLLASCVFGSVLHIRRLRRALDWSPDEGPAAQRPS